MSPSWHMAKHRQVRVPCRCQAPLRASLLRALPCLCSVPALPPQRLLTDLWHPFLTGKSYTMGTDLFSPEAMSGNAIGSSPRATVDEERLGIIPRAINQIFGQMESQVAAAGPGKLKFSAKNSYIEIYNEELIDLLVPTGTPLAERPTLQIREDKSGHILWTGLREVTVHNAREIMQ